MSAPNRFKRSATFIVFLRPILGAPNVITTTVHFAFFLPPFFSNLLASFMALIVARFPFVILRKWEMKITWLCWNEDWGSGLYVSNISTANSILSSLYLQFLTDNFVDLLNFVQAYTRIYQGQVTWAVSHNFFADKDYLRKLYFLPCVPDSNQGIYFLASHIGPYKHAPITALCFLSDTGGTALNCPLTWMTSLWSTGNRTVILLWKFDPI